MSRKLSFVREITGAFGDIGVFIPLALALIKVCGINHAAFFAIAGTALIFGGLFYGIPMPVQPLKAMAAIALGLGLAPDVISKAALLMGVFLIVLSFLKNVPGTLARIYPLPVIRGIQLGIGLLLLKSGLALIFTTGKNPGAAAETLSTGFLYAFFVLVIPQLPLTLGNAVMATVDCAKRYFGPQAHKVTEVNILRETGVFNLVAGFLGGYPICRGSGGVTAHHKFGARTGMASVILGILFILFAFLPASSVYFLLTQIPSYLLGMLVLYIGISHSLLGKDILKRDIPVVAGMGLVAFFTGNLTFSLLAAWSYILFQRKSAYAYR